MNADLALLVLAALGGLALAGLSAWRPVIGGAAICLVCPLTTGLELGSVGNFLKPDQIVVLLVFAGVALRDLVSGRRLGYGLLDLAVVAFCLGEVLIPVLVLWLGGQAVDVSALHTIAAPAEYLVVYLVFAREPPRRARLRLYCNLALAAVLVVALIGLLELLDVPYVRMLMGAAYQTPAQPAWDPTYRPGSTVIHFSGLAAVSLFGYTLALALAAARVEGMSQWWLAAVAVGSLLGLVASLTYAPLLVLPAVTLVVCLRLRTVPRALWVAGAGALPVGAALWPFLSSRFAQQLGGGGSLWMPESLATRVRYWQEFFYPAWVQHGLWLGTGSQLPGEVPAYLSQYVDNAYLDQAFRAGVAGILLSLGLYAAVGAASWNVSGGADRTQRAIGTAVLALTAALVALDLTSEYLTFAGFSQLFWMLVGLVGAILRRPLVERALVLKARWRLGRDGTGPPLLAASGWFRPPAPLFQLPAPLAVPVGAATSVAARDATGSRRVPVLWPRLRPLPLRRLLGEVLALAGASATVFSGFALARLLGFAFSVVAGRVLLPLQFGQLSYVLAAAAMAGFLVTSAPVGLSGYLARHRQDPGLQREYWSAWLVVLGAVLVASLALCAAAGPLLGIGGWLLAGMVANICGPAVLEAYLEVQRGVGRHLRGVGFYVAANLLQLLLLLVLWRARLASAPVLLCVYGLSSVAVLPLFLLLRPGGIRPSLASLRRERLREVLRFGRPILVQSVFYNVWISADLVLVGRLLGKEAAGYYGAAKTLSNVLLLAPMALGFVILPRVATATRGTAATQLWQALGVAAAAAVPTVTAVAIGGRLAIRFLFGAAYLPAALPLLILGFGFGIYCLYAVLSNACIGLGRPGSVALSSAAAAAGSAAGSLLLVPRLGIAGAALAFTVGSALQFALLVVLALRAGLLARSRPAAVRPQPETLGALDP